MSSGRSFSVLAAFLSLLLTTTTLVAQDLGHKRPGLLGLDAGRIPEPGLYFVDRLAISEAEKLRDRSGQLIPTEPFQLLGRANAFGLSYTRRIAGKSLFLTI